MGVGREVADKSLPTHVRTGISTHEQGHLADGRGSLRKNRNTYGWTGGYRRMDRWRYRRMDGDTD